MKILLLLPLFSFLCLPLISQPDQGRETGRKKTPIYTVSGERHGISFFPETRHSHVEYETGDVLSFDKYHSLNVIYDWLEKWADEYPALIDLYEMGKRITGYERAGDVYDDYGHGSPLFGHGPDFGYWYYGAIWYGDELWNGGRNKDYDGDGTIDQVDNIRWDDEENDGQGFFEWKPARHPVYGDIEIGGFDPKFFSQNPPSKHMEPWVRNQGLFNIEMAKHLPELVWDKTEEPRPVSEWEARGGYAESERPVQRRQASKTVPFTEGGSVTTALFNIRLYNVNELKGKASVISTRGGILKDKDFIIR